MSRAGLLWSPTGRYDPLGGTPMAGAGQVLVPVPPIHDLLDGEQERAPRDEDQDSGDVAYYWGEHVSLLWLGWLG